MLVRIVKMEFQSDKVDDFLSFFDTVKEAIASFEGCLGMKLMLDQANPAIIFTYSHWENQDALNKYRDSELFQSVWPATKALFASKAEASSLNVLVKL